MDIAIKYCGGCNPTYNRTKRITQFKEEHSENRFMVPKDGEYCDLWLVICGCSRKCASPAGLKARYGIEFVSNEADFRELERKLEGLGENQAEHTECRKLSLGEKAELTKIITEEDVWRFAEVTGDYNALHFDGEFARQTFFKNKVVHGMLINSLVSTVMGMKLPGPGTIFMNQETEFIKPVFVGDRIETMVEFVECDERRKCYIATFSGICRNQQGEIVLKAKCRQMMMKSLFHVEKTGGNHDEFREIQ